MMRWLRSEMLVPMWWLAIAMYCLIHDLVDYAVRVLG